MKNSPSMESTASEKESEGEGGEKSKEDPKTPSMSTSASAFFNNAFSSLGLSGNQNEEEEKKKDGESEKDDSTSASGPSFDLSSAFNRVGQITSGATKALKESLDGSAMLSEFNKEQEKFIKEKSKERSFSISKSPYLI